MWERTTEEEIQELVDQPATESLTLEYKECDSLGKTDGKKNEVSKDVSSFANSAGGAIVYGVIENNHEPERIDHGYDPNEISKEWLENVITSRIQPKIGGVIINDIKLSNGNYIYLVYVPQSSTAHQAHDKKYYKRYNFKSEPMEDYEIRDVMNRVKRPVLEPHFSSRLVDKTAVLTIEILNLGSVTVKEYGLKIALPLKILEMKGHGYSHSFPVRGMEDYQEIMIRSSALNLPPMFADDEVRLADYHDRLHVAYKFRELSREALQDKKLYWTVYAEGAPPRSGEIELVELHKLLVV
ncbi:ATP-binding protein [Acidobacteria bacterium AH-259-G07]|nr:ATP-binding protein [Acidobacteria bacterium AH-259-G07]